MWHQVCDKQWSVTTDKMSFQSCAPNVCEIPLPPHVGAFGVVRAHHTHEGIDLYVPQGTKVLAVEDGLVVAVERFTGAHAQTPWWHDTWAVLVEGPTGVVVYGEIDPHVTVGDKVQAGQELGVAIPVLKTPKGRPDCMLHLELHVHGTRETYAWETNRPASLLDPTPYCLEFVKHTSHTIRELI